MVKTSIKLPYGLYQAIDAEARKAGVGRSTLIRQLVEAGLAERQGAVRRRQRRRSGPVRAT